MSMILYYTIWWYLHPGIEISIWILVKLHAALHKNKQLLYTLLKA